MQAKQSCFLRLSASATKKGKKDFSRASTAMNLLSKMKSKFKKVNPYITTSIVNGTSKHWDGDAVFSMVQTISRERNLRSPKGFDMVVIDEGHHAAAKTYRRVVDAVLEDNDSAEIVGFTATPNRGDGKGLRDVFNNCAHQIEIGSLIQEGFLVRPKTFVVDLGINDQLDNVTRRGKEYDMEEVAALWITKSLTIELFGNGRKSRRSRKTVVFCSTVKHAEHLCDAFLVSSVAANFVTGETPKDERAEMLHDLEHGDLQVVVNVAVLTEGFDAPPVSCVILTRPCSQKGTMVQMIGRGLRIVDPELYPNTVKTDCIVMDFGTSVITHGSIDDAPYLMEGTKRLRAKHPQRFVPECESEVHARVSECPICGHEFVAEEKASLEKFIMTEYDLMQLSPFMWINPFQEGSALMAMGFQGFAFVGHMKDNMWVAMVKAEQRSCPHSSDW